MHKDHKSRLITMLLAAFSAASSISAGYLAASIAAPTGIGEVLFVFVGCVVAFRAALLVVAGLVAFLSPIVAAAMRGYP